jgi:dTDP-4-amino-4,6-dideoxygalactose transaminase
LSAAGDGGAIATNDADLAEALQRHRALGQKGQNNHIVVGYNSKLDSIQARILQSKLSQLDKWNMSRRQIAKWYRERLADLPLRFQSTDPDELHAYHLFSVHSECRDDLLKHLQRLGVDAVVRYPVPIHLQPAFSDNRWKAGQFRVAEELAKKLLCLPIRPDMQLEEVDYVTDAVRNFFRGSAAS